MSIRGKPPNLYTYAKGGGRIPLPGSRTQGKRLVLESAILELPPEKRSKIRWMERVAAVRNLQALPRTMKPPSRRP